MNTEGFSENEILVIGLGAQRSGSSWLHKYLADFPQCFASTVKEIEFFHETQDAFRNWLIGERCGHIKQIQKDIRLKGWLRQSEPLSVEQQDFLHEKRAEMYDFSTNISSLTGFGNYENNFARRMSFQTHILDFTPSYGLLSKGKLSEIAGCAPDVRFLFGIRDPIARSFSAFKYTMMLQSKKLAPRPRVRLNQLKSAINKEPEILIQSRYDLQIPKFESAIPKSKIHFYFHRELFTETALRSICAFLDLPYRTANFERKVHQISDDYAEAKPTEEEVDYLEKRLGQAYEYLHQRFGFEERVYQ